MTKLIATIQKVRYLTYPRCRTEVQYTVEGSDKVYKHTLSHKGYGSGDSDKIFWRNDKLWHLYKSFLWAFKSLGDGDRSKTIYDRRNSKNTLCFEIQSFKDGTFFLNTIRR